MKRNASLLLIAPIILLTLYLSAAAAAEEANRASAKIFASCRTGHQDLKA